MESIMLSRMTQAALAGGCASLLMTSAIFEGSEPWFKQGATAY